MKKVTKTKSPLQSESPNDLAAFLLETRLHVGLSQNEFGRKLGYLNGQYISNWERGLSYPPEKCWARLTQLTKISIPKLRTLIGQEKLKRIRTRYGVS